MNFGAPNKRRTLSHEEWIAQEAERMKWRREKEAARREVRVVFYDEETTIVNAPPKSAECSVDYCQTKPKAKGFCPKHYKAARRQSGKTN